MAAIGRQWKDKNLKYDKWWENYFFFPENSSCSESWSAVVKLGPDSQFFHYSFWPHSKTSKKCWICSLFYYLKTIKPIIFPHSCSFWIVVAIHEHILANVDQIHNIFFSTMKDIIQIVMKDFDFEDFDWRIAMDS